VTQIPRFGQRVARIRQELGLSVQELATRAHTTYQTIWRIETGAMKAPSIVLARRIARALGVGVDYLIGMFEEDEEESFSRKATPVG
jgi:transcriptional regulator with XRE-family HTH domain